MGSVFLNVTLVGQKNANSAVQVGQFAQASGQNIELIYTLVEDGCIGFKVNDGSAIRRLTDLFNIIQGLTNVVLLLVLHAVSVHVDLEQGRQCIHAANAHTVEATRDLVGVFVKLSAGVKYRHNHLQGRPSLFGVHGYRDAPTVVFYRNAV